MERWRTVSAVLLLLTACLSMRAREEDWLTAAMQLRGCSSLEELGAEDVETLSALHGHPLELNCSPASELLSSGLFSHYQVAVLTDHRKRSGPILSWQELSLLDGFTREYVSLLIPFLSLEAGSRPGDASLSPPALDVHAVLRSALRHDAGSRSPGWNASAGCRWDWGHRIRAGLSLSCPYDRRKIPERWSFTFSWTGKKCPLNVIAGDWRLCFGQGLTLWTGWSMNGLAAPESYVRRPSGISPTHSFSEEGTFRGVAASYLQGRWQVSAFCAFPGLRTLMEGKKSRGISAFAGAALSRYGERAGYSLLAHVEAPLSAGTTSRGRVGGCEAALALDGRWNLKGNDLFAEICLDLRHLRVAELIGCRVRLSDVFKLGFRAIHAQQGSVSRYSSLLPSRDPPRLSLSSSLSQVSGKWIPLAGKTGPGTSVQRCQGLLGVSCDSRSLRLLLKETIQVSPSFSLSCALSGKCRRAPHPGASVRFRSDLRFSDGRWEAAWRGDAGWGKAFSGLSYLEAGYRSDTWDAHLRAGGFSVLHWEDRIYVHERDAPGSFTVPARYGQGYWTAVQAGVRCCRGVRTYLRFSWTDYPWSRGMEKEKPGRAELRFQLVVDLKHRVRSSGS